MDRKKLWAAVKPYIWITLASGVYALGFDWFYAPNQISLAGITGFAQIINAAVPAISIGIAVIILNIPIFLLSWKLLGWHTIVSSLFATLTTSLGVDLLASLYTFQPMDHMLAAIFGGTLMGASLGVIFLQGSTTGGTDLIARMLKLKFAWLPMGRLLMSVELVAIAAVAITFRSLNSALYGLIALYVCTIVMDQVLYGMDTSKVAYIVSEQSQKLARAIDDELDRGATILHGVGGFSGQEKDVLMCAFKQKQIVGLKQIVQQTDPDAFMIVCDAHDVLGNGFHAYRRDDL